MKYSKSNFIIYNHLSYTILYIFIISKSVALLLNNIIFTLSSHSQHSRIVLKQLFMKTYFQFLQKTSSAFFFFQFSQIMHSVSKQYAELRNLLDITGRRKF